MTALLCNFIFFCAIEGGYFAMPANKHTTGIILKQYTHVDIFLLNKTGA